MGLVVKITKFDHKTIHPSKTLKSFTPNYRVYGDLGRYPIYIDIKIWSISYWARLLSGKQAKNLFQGSNEVWV
jgi:hypothetical protein